MNLFGYSRVSDKEAVKKGFSIEAQEESITDWCSANGHTLIRVFVEPGRSATKSSKTTRPTFERVVDLILAGAAEGLVVRWMDRFARNVEDFLRVRSQFYQAGKHLISISEPLLNGDPSDPIARYISTAIMNAYQLQAELSGLKSAQGRERRAAQGNYPGSLPLGYKRIANQVLIDWDHAPAVSAAFNEFSTGRWTLDTWTAEAARRGYLTRRAGQVHKSAWHRILRNKFYIGHYIWKEVEYQGNYETFIPGETFQAVQDLLDASGPGEQQRHDWLLSGLLWSEPLSKVMTGILVKNQYTYYRAHLPGQPDHSVPAADIEARVADQLTHIHWTGGRYYALPEPWRLAIKIAPNLRQVYDHLLSNEKRDFLRMIFLTRGIHITHSGRIQKLDLFPNFTIVPILPG